MTDTNTAISKFLSYVLRHHPESIGITLDSQGWVNIDTLTFASQVQHFLKTRRSVCSSIRPSQTRKIAQ